MRRYVGPPRERIDMHPSIRENERRRFWGAVCSGMGIPTPVQACAYMWALIRYR